jgi:hypothetical protein
MIRLSFEAEVPVNLMLANTHFQQKNFTLKMLSLISTPVLIPSTSIFISNLHYQG